MKILDKVKLGLRFLKSWGKPPRHTHNFSPEKLASLIENEGFVVEKLRLIGNETKAIYVIGTKR